MGQQVGYLFLDDTHPSAEEKQAEIVIWMPGWIAEKISLRMLSEVLGVDAIA